LATKLSTQQQAQGQELTEENLQEHDHDNDGWGWDTVTEEIRQNENANDDDGWDWSRLSYENLPAKKAHGEGSWTWKSIRIGDGYWSWKSDVSSQEEDAGEGKISGAEGFDDYACCPLIYYKDRYRRGSMGSTKSLDQKSGGDESQEKPKPKKHVTIQDPEVSCHNSY
jgi:hypothetical protein